MFSLFLSFSLRSTPTVLRCHDDSDFEEEEDADAAVKELNKATIQNIGEVHVSRATQRGYEDACMKRDIYQRTKGRIGEVYHCGRVRIANAYLIHAAPMPVTGK